MSGQYQIVYQGQLVSGFTRDEVKSSLMTLFALADEQTESLLQQSRAVLKTCSDRQLGERYQQQLQGIGLQVSLVAVVSTDGDDLHPSSATTESEPVPVAVNAATPVAAPAASDEPQRLPFQFSGQGGQYFGIWIVNLVLSILTLGIYSAWAKVRNKRYFYGHSQLDGENFEYSGKPLQILFGRLIAGALFLFFFFSELLSPTFALLSFVLTMAFLPWALRQSAKFNARNSWYRGLHFRFEGSLGRAYAVFLLWPFLALISLGLLFPWMLHEQQRYLVSGHRYGTQSFEFSARRGQYYVMMLMLLGIGLLGGLAIGLSLLLGAAGLLISEWLGGGLMALTTVLGYFALYILSTAFFSVNMANLRYNHSQLAEHRFSSQWQWLSYAKLLAVNTLLTVLTLGLFIPFAKVRSARYAAEHLHAVVQGNLDDFAAGEAEKVSAIGEGMADFFDFDLGL